MTQPLSSSDILFAWETATKLSPLDRAITILWVAGVNGDIAALSLGERDRALLRLRAATFGPSLSACITCPQCAEELEMEFEMDALVQALPASLEEQVLIGNTSVTIRSLTSHDLAALTAAAPEHISELLRKRLSDAEDLAQSECIELDRCIETREEQVELAARLTCTECSASWKEVLDIAAIFWSEVEAKAHRLFGEIAEIAAALGWSERDIIGLSEPRRQAYLSLARQR